VRLNWIDSQFKPKWLNHHLLIDWFNDWILQPTAALDNTTRWEQRPLDVTEREAGRRTGREKAGDQGPGRPGSAGSAGGGTQRQPTRSLRGSWSQLLSRFSVATEARRPPPDPTIIITIINNVYICIYIYTYVRMYIYIYIVNDKKELLIWANYGKEKDWPIWECVRKQWQI